MKRSELHPGDVVVTKTGVYFGKSAVIPNDIIKANMIAHVGKIELKKGYNPYYVSTFLNSKYGYYQLRRRGIKATRPEIKLVEFPEIMVPIFSEAFDRKIESIIHLANQILSCSSESISQCESILTREIGFGVEAIANTNYSVLPFSASFCNSGRLDAEYYQPKYDAFLDVLNRFETTSIPAEYYVIKNSGTNYADSISDVGVIKTKQLHNGGIDTESIESYFSAKTCVENKSTFLKSGDVIFASMGVGSLGKVSIFSNDGEKQFVTDSTLRIYRAKPTAKVRPEVLCVFLQSKLGQELIYRYVVGSTGIINIYDNDIAKIPIPIFDGSIQEHIAVKVQESFSLHRQSKQLLEYAKQAVEMAIEQGEDTALEWLDAFTHEQEA